MKQSASRILSATCIVMISLGCSLVTDVKATPTSDYIFTPSTTPLKIEPESLPGGQTGTAYEAEIRVSDNVTPVNNVSVASGALPTGLELVFVDHVNGATISGTPQEAGTFTFTISVSCFGTMVSGQSAEKEYVIVVE